MLSLSLFMLVCQTGHADQLRKNEPDKSGALQRPAENEPSVNTLLAEMNRNDAHMIQLLDKIVSEGCSRQLQVDTIKLVANMNRNIQTMTSIMVRMGYNIEELSRAPKKMNDLPFMP